MAAVISMATTRPVLSARGVTKVYRMGEIDVVALRGVDFDLFPRELVALLGASGSGKSTLLNILGGLDVPTTGDVHYADHDLAREDDALLTSYRREHVGFVFQFYNLIPSLTARENVALVTDIAEDPLEPADALGLVGLGDRLDHFPSQLSGGEQQRVAIARAVSKRPTSFSATSPPAPSTSRPGASSSRSWSASTASSGRRRPSSRTTPRLRRWPIASSRCPAG